MFWKLRLFKGIFCYSYSSCFSEDWKENRISFYLILWICFNIFPFFPIPSGSAEVREQRDEHTTVQLLTSPLLAAQLHGCFHLVLALCWWERWVCMHYIQFLLVMSESSSSFHSWMALVLLIFMNCYWKQPGLEKYSVYTLCRKITLRFIHGILKAKDLQARNALVCSVINKLEVEVGTNGFVF